MTTISPEGKSPDIRSAVIELQEIVGELQTALAALLTTKGVIVPPTPEPVLAPSMIVPDWSYIANKNMYAYHHENGQFRFFPEDKVPQEVRDRFNPPIIADAPIASRQADTWPEVPLAPSERPSVEGSDSVREE